MESFEAEVRQKVTTVSSDVESEGSQEIMQKNEPASVKVDHEVEDTHADQAAVGEENAVTVAEQTEQHEGQMTATPDEEEAVTDEEELSELEPRPFPWPTREQILSVLPFLAVILLGAILRFWGLGDKPLHHDESLHAYFSLQLMHQMENWAACFNPASNCYHYNPLLHGPFQFHIIALVYKISQLLGVYDHGVNTTTVRIAAASLGTVIVALPYFLRDYLGKTGAWLACFLIAVSPSLVYYSRFAREDIYMACFTLLMVVSVARYIRSRKVRWIIIAACAFSLSYATKEATFLSIVVFGSFFGALLAWELGLKWPIRARVRANAFYTEYLPRTAAPLTLLLYFVIIAPIGKVLFDRIKQLSIYVTLHTAISDAFVENLKARTVALLPIVGFVLAAIIFIFLLRELQGKLPAPGRHGLARHVDPVKQPLLDTIVTMPWIYWLSAFMCAWFIFLILFTVLFTNIAGGIGDGIWQGLYYWLQQQQIARGGQPWYYYLLLIPLYEQIGLVFGLVGVVRCLLRPTRFRLFLVYWFVGNLFIYSWAAEKMPWLTIHITMPMMLLAAIGLEPVVVTLLRLVEDWRMRWTSIPVRQETDGQAANFASWQPRPRVGILAGGGAIFGMVMAILLLLPTLQNMYQLTYMHAADAPHEMMVYVQTSTDVNTVMTKIEQVDRQFYGGKHQVPIGLTSDVSWPWGWYLRDYTNVCFNFPQGCPATAQDVQVFIDGQDTIPGDLKTYSQVFAFHQYPMRVQWDQGYMMPLCVPTATNPCTEVQQYVGVGPLLWLSYGNNPPPGATFDAGRAINNIWQWWWNRKAFGSTDGAYYMGLFIRRNIGVAP